MDRALQLAPDWPLYLNNRADLLLRMGRLDAALADADRVAAIHAEHALGWVTRGEIMLALGKASEALRCLDRAVSLNFPGPDAFFFRAVANLRLDHTQAALADLDAAARRDNGRFADRIAALRRQIF